MPPKSASMALNTNSNSDIGSQFNHLVEDLLHFLIVCRDITPSMVKMAHIDSEPFVTMSLDSELKRHSH